jgi:hypothetical protein
MKIKIILQLFPNWNHQLQEHFDALVMEKNYAVLPQLGM